MKIVHCANCGTPLRIARKAMPKYSRIIDVVEHHVCPDEPVEFNPDPNPLPNFVLKDENGKFVEKLNQLQPSSISTFDLRDRRKAENVKDGTAPPGVVDHMKMVRDAGDE